MAVTSENSSLDWSSAHKVLDGGKLSVVMPIYNLAGRIGGNLLRVAKLLEGHVDFEIVPVDDGSNDGSAEEIRAAEEKNQTRIHPVLLEKNVGKGNALREGFRASSGDVVLLLDGDLDLLPERLPGFFDAMAVNGADIVIGSKRHPESCVAYPWHRRLASVVYYSMVRLLVGLPVTDTQTGMKLFKRGHLGYALDRMLVKAFAFDLELLSIAHKHGAKIVEAPVTLEFHSVFGALRPSNVREVLKDTLAIFYRLRLLRYYDKVEVPPPMEKKPLISVVIACPCRSAMLDQCLKAIAGQSYRKFEVIVLPDDKFEYEKRALFGDNNVQIVPTGKVRPAEKRNIGIDCAKGEIVVFIDDDAYSDVHWLEHAVKYFSVTDIGAVGGPGVTPTDDGFFASAGGRVYESALVSGNYQYRYVGGRIQRTVDDYPSCNLFVRKDLLQQIGGYRVDFWPGEDTLLCKDIIEAGYRIIYDPWTLVFHHRRPLFAAHCRQLGRYAFHRGYFCKRYPLNSLHFSYFIPTLFVVYTAVAVAAILLYLWSPYNVWMLSLLVSPLALYSCLCAVSSFSFNPFRWAVIFAGIFVSHLTYGVRFAQGLMASRAPCEFIGKDHAKTK